MGTLLDDPGIRPSKHIFVGSKAPWFTITTTCRRLTSTTSPALQAMHCGFTDPDGHIWEVAAKISRRRIAVVRRALLAALLILAAAACGGNERAEVARAQVQNPSLKSFGAMTMLIEDPQRSKSFYEKVFGVQAIYEDENAVAFQFENMIVNLLKVDAAHELIEPATLAGRCRLRFQLTIGVDDVRLPLRRRRMLPLGESFSSDS